MRAFLAINLPSDERSLLHDALGPLRERMTQVRWMTPDALHVTLKFLGDIEGSDIERIGLAVRDALEPHAPLVADLGGLGGFPSLRRAAVVWVGVAPEVHLTRMQRDLEMAMSRLGFMREHKPFRGHVTVGRAQIAAQPPSLERLAGMVEYTGRVEVGHVDLMHTLTDAGTVRYETLARFALNDMETE